MPKKAKKHESSREDRISVLPDHLVQHILSFLVLKEVIATSVLAKRWRYLWTSVPTLDLGNWDYDSEYEVIPSSITNSLIQYRSQNITKFRVYFDYYNLRHQDIDTWIRFVVNRNVKEFDLSLLQDDDWDYGLHIGYEEEGYKVLGCLLNCESLEILKLAFCKLNLNVSSSSLCLLKELELRYMWLSNLDTSGCPLLESLIVHQCNLNQPLNIYAPNPKLGFLKIHDFNSAHPVTLFAPNLKLIQFDSGIREAYNIKNLSSLRIASFQLEAGSIMGKDTTPQLMEFLQGLLHASTLRLNHGFMKLLSFLDTEVKLPPSKSTCLELNITMQKSDLIGMAHVLRSAHSLETLILDISSITLACFQDRHLGDRDFGFLWESLGHSLSSIRSLKNVEIKNFLESESDHLYKDPGPNFNVNTFLANNWEKEIKLVKILLESCMMLQTMSIRTIDVPSRILKSEVLLLALTKRLLAFPRASTNAEIYFS